MSSGIIVSIKTKPYLKDWIIHKYGKGSEPVKATTTTKVFPLLAQYLTHRPASWKPPVADEKTILFELPQNKVMDVRDLCFILFTKIITRK